MKITIKKEHIRKGERRTPDSCPIALAIKEAGLGKVVYVNWRAAFVDGKEFPLPLEARLFVAGFDTGETVFPFSFNLDK